MIDVPVHIDHTRGLEPLPKLPRVRTVGRYLVPAGTQFIVNLLLGYNTIARPNIDGNLQQLHPMAFAKQEAREQSVSVGGLTCQIEQFET